MNEPDQPIEALTPEQTKDTSIVLHDVALAHEKGNPGSAPAPSTEPTPQIDPEIYKDARKRTYETMEKMELEYDKALLVLHPLGISVTTSLLVALWNKNATISPIAYGSMFAAWAVWLAGIIATLASFRISLALHQRVLDFLLEDKNPAGDPEVESKDHQNTWAARISGGAFVFGILLAAISLAIIFTTGGKS